jgi:hypothetical protein
MKEIAKMRLGVLRELKNVRRVIDMMEQKTKSRDPEAVQRAYMWLKTLVVIMDIGELSQKQVAINLELARALQEEMNNEI